MPPLNAAAGLLLREASQVVGEVRHSKSPHAGAGPREPLESFCGKPDLRDASLAVGNIKKG